MSAIVSTVCGIIAVMAVLVLLAFYGLLARYFDAQREAQVSYCCHSPGLSMRRAATKWPAARPSQIISQVPDDYCLFPVLLFILLYCGCILVACDRSACTL